MMQINDMTDIGLSLMIQVARDSACRNGEDFDKEYRNHLDKKQVKETNRKILKDIKEIRRQKAV